MKKYLMIAALLISTSVQAQGFSQFGIWDDYEPEKKGSAEWQYQITPPPMPETRFDGNVKVAILPEEPPIVILPNEEEPGTVLVDSRNKRLYLTLNKNEVFVYPISVGREGFAWSGTEQVSRIQYWPDWTPPKEMLQRRPDLPVFMAGGLKNPLGAVAIYLGNTLYRIHGTNDPKSIGRAESSGCIRMMNEHAVHLASQVRVGTVVKVFK